MKQAIWFCLLTISMICPDLVRSVDLLHRYPTSMTTGDTSRQRARAWEVGEKDVFQLSEFKLRIGDDLTLTFGRADLGIGRSNDGAVWAAAIPRGPAVLSSKVGRKPETVAHVWFRFHPSIVNQVFPPVTVTDTDDVEPLANIRHIARRKMGSSWQAYGRALIPEPHIISVDVDTHGGPRRFFVVDRKKISVEYHASFEQQTVPLVAAFDPELAAKAFDDLWNAFDREYAMFGIRPEVDWRKTRSTFRPRALAAKSTHEFAGVCNDMLKTLRDLHVHVAVAGEPMPAYSRPRPLNANPRAIQKILPSLKRSGREVLWAINRKNVGYVVITGWSDKNTPKAFDHALDRMRDTRGLILDVRLNGGGDEQIARQVAGRFHNEKYVYAYHQYRNGPKHGDLGEKLARELNPRGPWRYQKPVLLLIGQKCMSSNEAFVLMMSGAPNVKTFGDRTAGSSGNPRQVKLPFGITANLPRWIALQPDGKPFDTVGIEPDARFKAKPDSFTGVKDELLSTALRKMAD